MFTSYNAILMFRHENIIKAVFIQFFECSPQKTHPKYSRLRDAERTLKTPLLHLILILLFP